MTKDNKSSGRFAIPRRRFVAGSAAGAVPTGLLIDRIGRRKGLLSGLIVTAAAMMPRSETRPS